MEDEEIITPIVGRDRLNRHIDSKVNMDEANGLLLLTKDLIQLQEHFGFESASLTK